MPLNYIEYSLKSHARIGNSAFKKMAKTLSSQDQKNKKSCGVCVRSVIVWHLQSQLKGCADKRERWWIDEVGKFEKLKHLWNADWRRPPQNVIRRGPDDAGDVCVLPLRALEYSKASVIPGHHQLLEDCKMTKLLCWGRHSEVDNQQKCIDEYLVIVKNDQAYLVVHLKMKFEVMYCRKKQLILWEQRAIMAWQNGSHLIYISAKRGSCSFWIQLWFATEPYILLLP